MDFFYALIDAAKPYWAELIGTFLMGTMINLVTVKGAQKESFNFLSAAFFTLIARDVTHIILKLIPFFKPTFYVQEELVVYIGLVFTALSSALFMVAAMRNLRLYFSAGWVVVLLTGALSGASFIPSTYPFLALIKTYLPPLYLMLSLFIAGISFYLTRALRQNTSVRAVGNGLMVLSVCYGYQVFGLLANIQQILLLCYTVAIVLSLASQVQFLNVYNTKLTAQIESEKKSKYEIWEFSPFPIIISRLRDDLTIYMNPTARKMLSVSEDEVKRYPLADYFLEPAKKDELLNMLSQNGAVQSFEVLIHHPLKNNNMWISMTTRTTDFDEEIVLFSTFQDITERKKTEEILAEQAATDPLTGLYNRRQFEILAYQALQTARRYNTSYSIAMLDIDFFKKVNDTHGHDAGDAVLQNLAAVLQKTLRKSDIIARYGGEEFVVFFPQTPPEEAFVAAEHVRDAVSKMKTVSNGVEIPVSLSIGISDNQMTDLPALIKQADDALYYSKENGRNQTTLYRYLSHQEEEPRQPAVETGPAEESTIQPEPTVEASTETTEPPSSEPEGSVETADVKGEAGFSPEIPELPQTPGESIPENTVPTFSPEAPEPPKTQNEPAPEPPAPDMADA